MRQQLTAKAPDQGFFYKLRLEVKTKTLSDGPGSTRPGCVVTGTVSHRGPLPQGLLQGPLQQRDPFEHAQQVPLALGAGGGHLGPQLLLQGGVSGQLVQGPQQGDGGLEAQRCQSLSPCGERLTMRVRVC